MRLCEMGEKVLWYVPKKLKGKSEQPWRYGVFLGRALGSDQNYIGLRNGDVVRARAIVRLVAGSRWTQRCSLVSRRHRSTNTLAGLINLNLVMLLMHSLPSMTVRTERPLGLAGCESHLVIFANTVSLIHAHDARATRQGTIGAQGSTATRNFAGLASMIG